MFVLEFEIIVVWLLYLFREYFNGLNIENINLGVIIFLCFIWKGYISDNFKWESVLVINWIELI